VLDDLRWLGLQWDEGPDVGGPHASYRQSERLPLYRAAADDLLGRGLAYRCFCTDDSLEVRRKTALAAGRPPHYDGRCRKLDPAESAARAAAGEAHSIRFTVESRAWTLEDDVRGEVVFPPAWSATSSSCARVGCPRTTSRAPWTTTTWPSRT
jgi:glutamyl-tRNA synthetase